MPDSSHVLVLRVYPVGSTQPAHIINIPANQETYDRFKHYQGENIPSTDISRIRNEIENYLAKSEARELLQNLQEHMESLRGDVSMISRIENAEETLKGIFENI